MTNQRATGIILAGGKSTRLGRDKASELLMGVPLLQHAVMAMRSVVGQIIVVKARGQTLPAFASGVPLRDVDDDYPETGALGGVYTGLSSMKTEDAVVVACDMPLLRAGLLSYLLAGTSVGADAVVPLSETGQPEPLCAVYTLDCLKPIQKRLEAGQLKVTSFLEDVRTIYVQPSEWRRMDPDGRSFLNVNREEDLEKARALLT
jgi:molybdopterin-guanine dinucleotide biosynthesis protein A